MAASDRSYPFKHPATHQFYLPEQDPEWVKRQAPFGATTKQDDPYRLSEEGYRESDEHVLTQAMRDQVMAETLRMQRAYDIRHMDPLGRSADELLGPEEKRLSEIADSLLPKLPEDHMGPDLDTPNS